jgi:hypothetical protein
MMSPSVLAILKLTTNSNKCSFVLSLLKTRFERIDDGARQGSMRNNVSEPLDVEQRGDIFPARIGRSNRLGVPFRDVFIRAKFQGQTGSF